MKNLIKSIFLVNRCALCGKIQTTTDTNKICIACMDDLPLTSFAPKSDFQIFNKGNKRFLRTLVSPFYYYGSVRLGLLRFKFKDKRNTAIFFADYLLLAIEDNYFYKGVDYIIPVPISKRRLRERGYNQSELIANLLSKRLNKPLLTNSLLKIKDNMAQSKSLSVKERIKNVYGVYEVDDKSILFGKKILLVDDIVTTGATLNECAKTLISAGCCEVVAVAVATKK